MSKHDTRYKRWQHWLFERLPATQLLGRLRIWLLAEYATYAMTAHPMFAKGFELRTEQLRRRYIKDPGLRAKLKPDYQLGCKRILFSNDYLPALAKPNVQVETGRITEITANGVRTVDGVEHPADVIIYGTGFAATEFLGNLDVRGIGGRKLADSWSAGARAYLGMTVPDFSNMFCMYGPEHQSRRRLNRLHDRAAGQVRAAGCPAHRAAKRVLCRRPAGCGRTLRQGSPAAAREECLDNVRQLVPPGRWARVDELAGPGLGIRPAHPEAGSDRIPHGRGEGASGMTGSEVLIAGSRFDRPIRKS
jgi:cation diffusion facilitator CzcD-associated flavoprotein CzcO